MKLRSVVLFLFCLLYFALATPMRADTFTPAHGTSASTVLLQNGYYFYSVAGGAAGGVGSPGGEGEVISGYLFEYAGDIVEMYFAPTGSGSSGGGETTVYVNGSQILVAAGGNGGASFILQDFSRVSSVTSNNGSGYVTINYVGSALPALTPEPSSLLLIATGMAGAVGALRRRSRL